MLAKKAGTDELAAASTSTCSSSSRSATSPSRTSACCTTRSTATASSSPTRTSIEQTWRIVQPLLDDPPPVELYETGTWGPEAASHLLDGHGGWRKPWLPEAARLTPRKPSPAGARQLFLPPTARASWALLIFERPSIP